MVKPAGAEERAAVVRLAASVSSVSASSVSCQVYSPKAELLAARSWGERGTKGGAGSDGGQAEARRINQHANAQNYSREIKW